MLIQRMQMHAGFRGQAAWKQCRTSIAIRGEIVSLLQRRQQLYAARTCNTIGGVLSADTHSHRTPSPFPPQSAQATCGKKKWEDRIERILPHTIPRRPRYFHAHIEQNNSTYSTRYSKQHRNRTYHFACSCIGIVSY